MLLNKSAIREFPHGYPIAARRIASPTYPRFPYSPPEHYPEFTGWHPRIDPENQLYEAIRNVLRDLGLDRDNLNRNNWNPFRGFIEPGQRVLIKPNWVLHANQLDGSIESLVTHTSVVRVMLDYVALALDGLGTVEVADAPLQGCDFRELRRRTRMDDLLNLFQVQFPNITFSILDLRKTILTGRGGRWSVGLERQSHQVGDPRGYTLINLGRDSLLTDIQDRSDRFRVTMYDHRMMARHHTRDRHEYLVANSVLSADFIINVPKLKTHIKAGVTGALKNLVGINGHKEYLPHHVAGYPGTGGDQYQHRSMIKPLINRMEDSYWRNHSPRGRVRNLLQASLIRILRQPSRFLDRDRMFDGGWHGNDTIPRTTLDLNNIMYFYSLDHQKLSSMPVRSAFHIVDGVIAGEGYGPLKPSAKPLGVIAGGWNPLSLDLYGARLIGLNPMKIRLLRYGLEHPKSRLADRMRELSSMHILSDGKLVPIDQTLSHAFQLPVEWKDAAL